MIQSIQMTGKTYKITVSNICHIYFKFFVSKVLEGIIFGGTYNPTHFILVSGQINPRHWDEFSQTVLG